MARIRTIKPEFPQSESMGRVSRESRLLFILLWTIADDSGRLRGNSRMLASLLYPYDDDAINRLPGWLKELSDEGCIQCYEIERDHYIAVLNWSKHQKIDKPSASKIASPPEIRGGFANVREDSRESREDSSEDQGSRIEGSRIEGPLLSPAASGKKRFVKPSSQEVEDYAESIDFALDGETFCAYYETRGWKVSGKPMVKWQSAVVTWKKNATANGTLRSPGSQSSADDNDPIARVLRNTRFV